MATAARVSGTWSRRARLVGPSAIAASRASSIPPPQAMSRWRLTKVAIGVVGETANRDSISGVDTLKWPHSRH